MRTFIVLCAIVSLFLILDALDSSRLAAIQNKGVVFFIGQQIVLLPSKVYELMPLAVLLGCVWALSLFSRHSELTVMRVSNMTVGHLARIIFIYGFLMGLTAVFVDEVIDVWASKAREKMLGNDSKAISQPEQSNLWLRSGGQFIHVERLSNTQIQKLLVIRLKPDFSAAESILWADSGEYINGRWQLKNGGWYPLPKILTAEYAQAIQALTQPSQPYQPYQSYPPNRPLLIKEAQAHNKANPSPFFVEKIWDDGPQPRFFTRQDIDASALKLLDIIRLYQFNRSNALRSEPLEVELWKKLFYPLMLAIIAITGIPFSLSAGRDVQSNVRLLIGIIIGIFFFVVQGIFSNLGLLALSPLISVLAPLMLFLMFTMMGIWWATHR